MDLRDAMDLDQGEVQQRKSWLQFDGNDVELLRELSKLAERYADAVIDELDEHFLSTPETVALFKDPEVLDQVKALQCEYFIDATGGRLRDRLRGGSAAGRVGPRTHRARRPLVPGRPATCTSALSPGPSSKPTTPATRWTPTTALTKLVLLDIELAIDTYTYIYTYQTIRQQQEPIVRPGLDLDVSTALDLEQGLALFDVPSTR